ncbi:hypothetical protein CSOJ01_14129 [Colletotrichum sojae]|uniref:Uncharacterized protein n=1 Tax=Colletotrichum sojae TaxID=2175907 RepID=A0A8H6IQL8_9PEZI|nr:hypothetical protein CSOJ01_14129 [Colletotrichum sojae]
MRDPTEQTRLPALARRWTPEDAVKSREREMSLRDWRSWSSVVEGRSIWARVDRLLTFWKNSAAAEAGRWTSRRLVRSMAPFEKRGAHKTTRYRPAPSPSLANRLSEAGGEGKVPERKVQLCSPPPTWPAASAFFRDSQAQGCAQAPRTRNSSSYSYLQQQLQLQLAAAIYGYRSGSVFSPIASFHPAASHASLGCEPNQLARPDRRPTTPNLDAALSPQLRLQTANLVIGGAVCDASHRRRSPRTPNARIGSVTLARGCPSGTLPVSLGRHWSRCLIVHLLRPA